MGLVALHVPWNSSCGLALVLLFSISRDDSMLRNFLLRSRAFVWTGCGGTLEIDAGLDFL